VVCGLVFIVIIGLGGGGRRLLKRVDAIDKNKEPVMADKEKTIN